MEYKKETANMTFDEEMSHWYNRYIGPEVDRAGWKGTKDAEVDTSILEEEVSERELLEWEAKNSGKS